MTTGTIRHRAIRRLALFLAIALTLIGVLVPAAESREPTTGRIFGIRAGMFGQTTLEDDHFTYDVEGGTSVVDSIEVLNFLDRTLEGRVYPADMITAKGGGLSPAQESAPRKRVGDWIAMEHSDLSVPPGGTIEVPFEISVPTGVVPGEYLGAVVVAVTAGVNPKGMALETRAARMVRVRVPGEVRLGVDVEQVRSMATGGARKFEVVVRNTGNVLFTVAGSLDLRSGGRKVGKLDLSPSDIYVIPGGEAEFEATWKAPPSFGRVKSVASFDVELNDEIVGTYSSRPVFLTLVPLLKLAGALTLAGGGVLLTRATGPLGIRKRRIPAHAREVLRR